MTRHALPARFAELRSRRGWKEWPPERFAAIPAGQAPGGAGTEGRQGMIDEKRLEAEMDALAVRFPGPGGVAGV
ncbi:MAG: hypothetical protein LCH99_35165, partial [Proteobacteria bacterium]|nr:hypothetical protein [Pseudomonadota bacterium]